VSFPKKKYTVIYADPPWEYKQKQMNLQSYGKGKRYFNHVTEHYSTMSVGDLKSLPVASITSENGCLLFMWTTGPQLDVAIEIGTAWGFRYRTIGFVWEKQRTNWGFYTLSSVELCLVFKKGPTPKRQTTNVRQFLSEKLTMHSVKPSEIRNRITMMFPDEPKIELFARIKTKGWDVWGNEV
jgi:N6-adenosine-specific RNA methylase IME4